jgi:acyl carrier protein
METENTIRELLHQVIPAAEPSSFKGNIPLDEQGVDSLDMSHVMLLVEEKLGVRIPDEDLDSLRTLDDIVAYVTNKSAG